MTDCLSAGISYLNVEWDGISLYLWFDDCLAEQQTTIDVFVTMEVPGGPSSRVNGITVPTEDSKYDMSNVFGTLPTGVYKTTLYYTNLGGWSNEEFIHYESLTKIITVDYPKLVADVSGDFTLAIDGSYVHETDGMFTLTAQEGLIVRVDISGDVEETIYVNNDTFTLDTAVYGDWRNCNLSVLVSDRDSSFTPPSGAKVIFQCVYDNCVCTVSAPSYTVSGSLIYKTTTATTETPETLPTITFTTTNGENITRIDKYVDSTIVSTAFPATNPYVYSPGTQEAITYNKNYKLKITGNGAGYSQYNVILTISGNAVDGAGNYKGSVSVNGTKYTASTTLSYNIGVSSAFTIMCTGGMNITSVTKDGATQTLANPTTCFVTLNATTATTIRLNVTFDGNTGTSHVIKSKVAPGYEKDFIIYPNGSSTVTHGGNSEPYYLSTSMESPSYTVWIDSVKQYLANPASYTFTNVTSNHNIVIAPWTWSPIKCVR